MRISCPSCQSSYKIADEKVKGRTVRVRCRKCGLTIHVNEHGVMNEAEADDAASSPAADPSAPQFSVLVAEGDQRDMSMQDIVSAYNSGVVTGDTFVWSEGQPDWMPLVEVASIVEALNAASEEVDKAATGVPQPEPDPGLLTTATPGPVAPVMESSPEPAPEPAPEPVPESAPAAFPQPEAVIPPPEVAAPAAEHPLFGQSAGAGAGAVATPSPLFGGGSPAAVQTSHDKRPDLFSPRTTTDNEPARQSVPQPSPAVQRPTGTRDESSVLFSLSALTSAAAVTSSASTTVEADDSGLIDLRALADKDAGAELPAAPVGGILDAAPLLGTPFMDPSLNQLQVSEPPPPKKNKLLITALVIAGLGIAGLATALAVLLMREPPAPVVITAPVETEDQSAATVPIPIPTDTGSSAAAPPATGAASTPPPSTTARVTGPRPKATGTAKDTTTAPGKTDTATTPTKKPPANKCNCPPGDLACNMACAVK